MRSDTCDEWLGLRRIELVEYRRELPLCLPLRVRLLRLLRFALSRVLLVCLFTCLRVGV
jgi:hypothetical protein